MTLDVAQCLAAETMHQNDDDFADRPLETDAERWIRMRRWAAEQIVGAK